MARLTPPKIQNEMKLDGREVAGIVRWTFRFLDVDGAGVMVKVKRTSRACGGRFYPHPHESGGHIWKEAYRGAGYGDYVAVGPQVPPEIKRLIVARVGDPEIYPRTYRPYRPEGQSRRVGTRRLARSPRDGHRPRGSAPAADAHALEGARSVQRG